MTLTSIIFYVFAVLAVVSAGFILFTKNILYAAFALLATFLAVAAMYVFAGADFVAITQIIIYVGGILVLILFGVFLTTKPKGQQFFFTGSFGAKRAWVLTIALAGILIFVFYRINFSELPWISIAHKFNQVNQGTSIQKIGTNLLTTEVMPFEVIAVLLMAALMGAAYIASSVIRKENKK